MGYLLNAGSGCCQTCRPSPCDPCTPAAACCMYPWPTNAPLPPAQIDPGNQVAPPYSPDDLPAELLVEIVWVNPTTRAQETDTAVLARGSSGYGYGGTASTMQTHDPDVHEPLGISLFLANSPVGEGGSNGYQWQIIADSSAFAGSDPFGGLDCLEQDYVFSGGGDYVTSGGYTFTVKDRFADTYMANTVKVTRISPCQWTGTSPSGVSVLLDYGITTQYAWSILGVPKDPGQTQDSPEGSYDNGGITVAAAT